MDHLLYEKAVKTLLSNKPDAGAVNPNIKVLVNYLAAVTDISANDDMNDWHDINTEQGVAISPVQAAKCLQEPLRSQKFMQGVQSAISDQLAKNNGTINVLYAGTGPYGTLLLPLLSILKNNAIKVTLIDIHSENIQAITKLIKHLGIEDNIIDIVCADATKWQNPNSITFDIIISETMTALLKREPQVYIFAHLSQYLNLSGVLIPEQVSLKAWASNNQEKVLLGEFFKLDIDLAKAINAGDTTSFSGELLIPDNCNIEHECTLSTDITIYKEHCLTTNECSLNVPLTFPDYHANLIAGECIKYEYVNPSNADFIFSFPKNNLPENVSELTDYDAKTQSGLVLFKRIHQRTQIIKQGKNIPQDEQEWSAQNRLFELLALPLHEGLQELHQHASFESFERWLNEHCSLLSQQLNVNAINKEVMSYLTEQ